MAVSAERRYAQTTMYEHIPNHAAGKPSLSWTTRVLIKTIPAPEANELPKEWKAKRDAERSFCATSVSAALSKVMADATKVTIHTHLDADAERRTASRPLKHH